MKTIRNLLDQKGGAVVTIAPESSVFEALELMARQNIGALVVVEGDRLCGLMSERDYARKVILKGKRSPDTTVREIMTAEVVCVEPHQKVDASMSLMTDRRVRHLPVLEEGHLIGIISIGDVVKAIIAEQQSTIEQLEDYITSGG
jgi:CBS domain-containing protein